MRVDVIISNYNYGNFLKEAINSVLIQTYKGINLIIIDDGSTDNSRSILRHYEDRKHIKIIYKKNAGQLSTFNEAMKYITGELIFFLDSDDVYQKNYIEEAVNFYTQNNDCDFLFCGMEYFDKIKSENCKFNKNISFGFSFLRTYYLKEWIGSETSTLSMRKNIFIKIMPIPFEKDWITRADDCLVFGSSLVGAKKYYLNKSLVKYRVHGKNNFYEKEKLNINELYLRELSINKLFNYLIKKNNIRIELLRNLFILEYESVGIKNFKNLKSYMKILFLLNMNILFKFKWGLSILKKYIINILKISIER
jgi:glycosyltransferase involved in cell wall biosynthesis